MNHKDRQQITHDILQCPVIIITITVNYCINRSQSSNIVIYKYSVYKLKHFVSPLKQPLPPIEKFNVNDKFNTRYIIYT